MILDPDLVRLPHSFPSFDVATPTPSTTNLHEPPEGDMPTTFLQPDTNHVISLPDDTSDLQHVTQLCAALARGQAQAEILRVSLFEQAKKGEQTRPTMPVLMVHQDKMAPTLVTKYQRAQQQCDKNYAMSTLITTSDQLQIEGRTPTVAVLDTSVGAIILGKTFASRIEKCQPDLLQTAGTLITASGAEEKGFKKTAFLLNFTLAKGTSEETNITATAIIADTDTYDVLLGMEFWGSVFGYIDPLTKEFLWRVDCLDSNKMPTRLV